MFGILLQHTILAAGIHADHLIMDPKIPTTLAFVKTFSNGDRDFSFYRKPGADMMLTESELPEKTIANARIFHFGTLSMTHEGVRAAAVVLAKEGGALISFDPNLRPPLWENLEDAKEAIAWGLSQCDILKIADNELEFMTGETDFVKGAAILQETYPNIQVLNVTAGADGSYSFYGEEGPAGRHLCRLRFEKVHPGGVSLRQGQPAGTDQRAAHPQPPLDGAAGIEGDAT